MERRSNVEPTVETWECRPVSSRVSVPMVVTASRDGQEQLVAKVYAHGGGLPGRSAAKARTAKARAEAFKMMPEALRALRALLDAFPASGPVNQAKVKQAYVRGTRVMDEIPNVAEIMEFPEAKPSDGAGA